MFGDKTAAPSGGSFWNVDSYVLFISIHFYRAICLLLLKANAFKPLSWKCLSSSTLCLAKFAHFELLKQKDVKHEYQSALKTNFGLNNRPYLAPKVSKEALKRQYDILKEFMYD